jgi:cell division protein ZipA
VLAEKRQEPRFEIAQGAPAGASGEAVPAESAEGDAGAARSRVADVIMPDAKIVADEAAEGRRRQGRRAGGVRQRGSDDQPAAGGREGSRDGSRGRSADRQDARDKRGRGRTSAPSSEPVVQELIVINVVAPRGQHFEGPALVEGLRARGLRYGEMNIFHRVDPMTRAVQYSVANVLEPGTFDMADIENFRSPGVCFFMQLPGPESPLEAFEDMLKAARNLALQLGGELKDEQRSVMTGQTVEHYRQRIAEFRRRLMSMRA